MQRSDQTAREIFLAFKADSRRLGIGWGQRPALVNIDLQKAYTCVDEFGSAYENDPDQLAHVNALAAMFRERRLPVVWTYVAYMPSGEDCGLWNLRPGSADSLRSMTRGSRRAELDDRLAIDHENDLLINKRMASAFHETNLASFLTLHRIDTLVVTGGSTSGCVRSTVVDSLSRGYRTIVPEECVADRHESPHFASLYDIAAKYGDVVPVAEVFEHLRVL